MEKKINYTKAICELEKKKAAIQKQIDKLTNEQRVKMYSESKAYLESVRRTMVESIDDRESNGWISCSDQNGKVTRYINLGKTTYPRLSCEDSNHYAELSYPILSEIAFGDSITNVHISSYIDWFELDTDNVTNHVGGMKNEYRVVKESEVRKFIEDKLGMVR